MILNPVVVSLFRFRLRRLRSPDASWIWTLHCLFLLLGQIGLGLRGIVIRVTRRHLSVDFLTPSVKTFAEFFDFIRHLTSQIALFTDVIFQVVELNAHFSEELDELEVAFVDRAIRRSTAFLVMLI